MSDAAPESMITWSGTRHKVGGEARGGQGMLLTAGCNISVIVEREFRGQRRPTFKQDCKRCYPPSAVPSLDTFRGAFDGQDFGSDTLTDLERARQQNAALQSRIDAALALCGEAKPLVLGGGCHAPFAVGGVLVDAARIRAALAGDPS